MPSQNNEVGDHTKTDISQVTSVELAKRLDALWDRSETSKCDHATSLLGSEFGTYRIEELIGEGAFGVVYKARNLQNDQFVALKLPRPHLLANPEALHRFESEAKSHARLEHESIVSIIGFDVESATPYIASAFCEGPDLAKWLQTQSIFSQEDRDIASFVLNLCKGIDYAHGMGVIHRDIKPSNIMMTKSTNRIESKSIADFQPKLTDFGLAKLTTESITNSRSSFIIGTPMYMAPEQLLPNWGPATPQTDVFSIGALMFELLEGAPLPIRQKLRIDYGIFAQ